MPAIKGHVVDAHGIEQSGYTAKLVYKLANAEPQIGATQTLTVNPSNDYNFLFDVGYPVSAAFVGAQVEVYDGTTKIGESPVVVDPGDVERIDVVVNVDGKGTELLGPAEVSRIKDALSKLAIDPIDHFYNADEERVKLVAARSGVHPQLLALYRRACYLGRTFSVEPDLLYALGREKFAMSFLSMGLRSADERADALAAAVDRNILEKVDLTERGQLDEALEAYVRSHGESQVGPLITKTRVADELGTSAVSDVVEMARTSSSTSEFWATLRGIVPQEAADELELATQLAAITLENTDLIEDLINARREGGWTTIGDLAGYSVSTWTSTVSGFRPDEYDTDAEYAADIYHRFEEAAPTAAAVRRLAASGVLGETLAADLISFCKQREVAHQDEPEVNDPFDLQTRCVDDYLAVYPLSSLGDALNDDEETRLGLKRIERLFRLVPIADRSETMAVLYAAGITSAMDILTVGEERFVATHEEDLESAGIAKPADVAKEIYRRAQQISAIANTLYTGHSGNFHTASIPALGNLSTDANGVAGFRNIFGAPSSCTCSHCRSIFGPAAYYADLLSFLEGRGLLTDLRARRLDLQKVNLDCDNTHIGVPTIDLVNEVLETEVAVEGGQTVAPESYERQTSGSTEERRAAPEHVLPEAYDVLKTSVAGLELPYDRDNADVEGFLAHCGASKAAVADAIARHDGERSIAARAYLGVRNDLDAETVERVAADNAELSARWGISDWQLLSDVRTFMARSELSYAGVEALLELPSFDHLSISFGTLGDLDTASISFTFEDADLINRILRLKKRSGWSLHELERAFALYGKSSQLSWSDIEGVVTTPTSITKTSSSTSFDAGCASQQTLSGDGCVSFASGTGTFQDALLGFSQENLDHDWASIEFALNMRNNGDLWVYESGIPTVLGTYSPGDRFKIEIRDSQVRYYQNGALVHTSSGTPTMPLLLDSSLASVGASIVDIELTAYGDVQAYLASVEALHRRLDVERETLSSWLLGIIDNTEYGVMPSYADRLLPRGIPTDTETFGAVATQLAADLGVKANEVLLLAGKDAVTNAAGVADLCRNVGLAKALALSIEDYATLKELLPSDPFASVDALNTFLDEVEDLRESGLTVAMADYVLRHESDSSLGVPDADAISASLEKLEQALAGLPEDTAEVKDRENTIVETLASLGQVDNTDAKAIAQAIEIGLGGDLLTFLVTVANDATAADDETLRFAKVARLLSWASIPSADIPWIFGDESIKALLNGLPTTVAATTTQSADFTRFCKAAALRHRLVGKTEALLSTFDATDTIADFAAAADIDAQALADVLGWFGKSASKELDDYVQAAEVLDSIAPTGLAPSVFGITDAGTSFVQGAADAANVERMLAAAKANQPLDAWQTAIRPLRDQLRRQQRDALVTYLIQKVDSYDSPSAIYADLLIDVEMEPCQTLTRLKAAIGSVQQYIQRIFLRLEGSKTFSEEDARLWEWMKSYRIWEANRKVFIYPENWLEPSLRDDKTPFFLELEQELAQGEITEARVEEAVTNYLEKLDEVSKLDIRAICSESHDDGATLHVIGRTSTEPSQYFYRRRDNGFWHPWESLDLDIEGDHLILVAENRRLYLFWPVFGDGTIAVIPDGMSDQPEKRAAQPPRNYYTLRLGWCERYNGKWSRHKASTAQIAPPNTTQDAFVSSFFKKEVDSTTQEFGLGAWVDVNGDLLVEPARRDVDRNRSKAKHLLAGRFRLSAASGDVTVEPSSNGGVVRLAAGRAFEAQHTVGDAGDPLALSALDFAQGDYELDYLLSAVPRDYTLLTQARSSAHNATPIVYRDDKQVFLIEDNNQYRPRVEPPSWMNGGAASFNVGALKNQLSGKAEAIRHDPWSMDPGMGITVQEDTSKVPPVVDIGSLDFPSGGLLAPLAGKLQTSVGQRMSLLGGAEPTPSSNNLSLLPVLDLSSSVGSLILRSKGAPDPGEHKTTIGTHQVSIPTYQATEKFTIPAVSDAPDSATLLDKVDWQRYRFTSLIHPYARDFRRAVNVGGIWELYRPKRKDNPLYRQQVADLTFFGTEYYASPSGLVLTPFPVEKIDFTAGSPYGVYNWEVFVHIPQLVSEKLRLHGRFEEARRWLHTVFDPTVGGEEGEGAERFWRVAPFYQLAKGPSLDVTWKNAVGVETTNDSIRRTTLGNGWDAGACSENSIVRDGYVQFRAGDTHLAKMVGLSHGDSDQTFIDIDFAVYFQAGGGIHVYEKGSSKGIFGTYTTDDTFRVEAVDGVVTYYKNNVSFYTSSQAPTFPLRLDLSLFNQTASITHISLFDATTAWDETPNADVMALLSSSKGEDANALEKRQAMMAQIEAWLDDPFSPHAIARLRHNAYQRAILCGYLDVLIEWGDALFRRDSIESINEATQLYVLAAELLGNRPEALPGVGPDPRNFDELKLAGDGFSNALVEVEGRLPELEASQKFREIQLPLGRNQAVTRTKDGSGEQVLYFGVPANAHLVTKYWDRVADRLLKIRNCQDINGKVRSLPIWEPAIDPALLVRAKAMGLDLATVINNMNEPLPPYRFERMLATARSFCQEVQGLEGALLAAVEKRDAEELSRLRAVHQVNMDKAVEQVRKEQLAEARHNLASLQRSRDAAIARIEHYANLPQVVEQETQQARHLRKAARSHSNAEAFEMGLKMVSKWEEFTSGSAGSMGSPLLYLTALTKLMKAGMDIAAKVNRDAAARADRSAHRAGIKASHAWREIERAFKEKDGTNELASLEEKVLAAEISVAVAELSLENHQKSVEQGKEVSTFLERKFTNFELYEWMVNSLSSLHYQAYELALQLARRAERCLQFELGKPTEFYVRYHGGGGLRSRLFSGRELAQDLNRMEEAFLKGNEREYEMTRHISLGELNPLALIKLRNTRECSFKLPEELFDADAPQTHLRRIKSLALSIPSVVGPYAPLHVSLTLTAQKVRVNDNGTYTLKTDRPDPVTTSIVTSGAQMDSGLFETNLNDPRYLPFEGAGAVSDWTLELPQVAQLDYQSISDVIVHLRYTAKPGGPNAAETDTNLVNALLTADAGASHTAFMEVVDVAECFPDAWESFLEPEAEQSPALSIELTHGHFPRFVNGKTTKCKELWAILEVYDDEDGEPYALDQGDSVPLQVEAGVAATGVATIDDLSLLGGLAAQAKVGEDAWPAGGANVPAIKQAISISAPNLDGTPLSVSNGTGVYKLDREKVKSLKLVIGYEVTP